MIYASGILFLAPDDRVLFLKRGPGGDCPGEWCFPGGGIEDGETPEEAAVRESVEEIGSCPDGPRAVLSRVIRNREVAGQTPAPMTPQPEATAVVNTPPDETIVVSNSGPGADDAMVDFTTFLQKVPAEFQAKTNEESVGWCWAPVDQPPEPLHPGCRVALARLRADELEVARMMSRGELTSPQKYENVWLFDVRITGTGMSYRRALDEFVWRDPSLYLNDEFLARCNGLAVIVDHPEASMLTGEEYAKRVAGSILLPYVKGDEVWGIAKIYDEATARIMSERQLSTSPAVVFRDPKANEKVELEDGSKLLIEGKPSLLDHLAICERGVWDKGLAPSGVRKDSEPVRRRCELPHSKVDLALAKARQIRMSRYVA